MDGRPRFVHAVFHWFSKVSAKFVRIQNSCEMKKLIYFLLLAFLPQCFLSTAQSQLGSLKKNLKKPSLKKQIPSSNEENSTNSSSESSNQTNQTQETSPKSNGPSKEEQLASEEAYFEEMSELLGPYENFVIKVRSRTQMADIEEFSRLYSAMNYKNFTNLANEIINYEPIDKWEFGRNDIKSSTRSTAKDLKRFFENEIQASKNAGYEGSSYQGEGSVIKENLLDVLDNNYFVLSNLDESHRNYQEHNKYLNVDSKIKSLRKAVTVLEFWLSTEFVKEDRLLQTDLQKFKEQKAKLENIKSTGADVAYFKKRKAETLAKIKFAPSRGSASAYQAAATRKVEELEKGQVKKVVVIDDYWYVVKNALGIPLQKELATQVGYQKNGQCYLINGDMVKEYLGGGSYDSKAYFSYNTASVQEMSCSNLK